MAGRRAIVRRAGSAETLTAVKRVLERCGSTQMRAASAAPRHLRYDA